MSKEKLSEALKYYANHPYEYVIDILKVKPTEQQAEVLKAIPEAIKEKKGIAVKSGHGTGKTAIESWIIKWFMDTRPFPKIAATAGTQQQLHDVLWAELAKWHRLSLTKDTCEWRRTYFFNKKYPERWFASARTSNNPDNLAGIHAEHVLYVVEEASAVPDEVLEVIEGSQTQEGSLVMMFGNPTQITGGFYDAFNSKRKFFKTFTFNSEKSPIVSKQWCEKQAAKYGRDSDFYRVRVLGEFPSAEPDTLIPLDKVIKATNREITPLKKMEYETVELGVDVARFGDDESTIFSRIGNIIKMEKILRKKDLMFLTGEIVQIINKFKDKYVIVNIDDVGVGGGVVDRLNELVANGEIRAEIVGVNNGSRAEDEQYVNLGTELWFFMKQKIEELKIPNNDDLIAQLSGRKYKITSSGKIAIEPKDQMKRRGLTSPDRADGCILTLRSLVSKNIPDDMWSAVA